MFLRDPCDFSINEDLIDISQRHLMPAVNKSGFFFTTGLMYSNISSVADPECAVILTSLFFDNKFLRLRYFITESPIIAIFFFGEFLSLESKFGFLFLFWSLTYLEGFLYFYYYFETYQYCHCFSYHYLLIDYY